MKTLLTSLLLATALLTPSVKAQGFDSAFDIIEDMGMGAIFGTDGNDARNYSTPSGGVATDPTYCPGGAINSVYIPSTNLWQCK